MHLHISAGKGVQEKITEKKPQAERSDDGPKGVVFNLLSEKPRKSRGVTFINFCRFPILILA